MSEASMRLYSDVEEYILYGTPRTTKRDCDFLERIIDRTGKGNPRLLDLACGTGRHSIEMALRGYDVTGIDISTAMIDYATRSTRDENLENCHFKVANFLEHKADGKFDIAFCLFNTISLIIENEKIIRLFENTRDNLKKSGFFIIHLYSMWKFISEGTFTTEKYENKSKRDLVVRIEKGRNEISNVNNVYKHIRKVQYHKGKKQYPEADKSLHQRVYSINEIDLVGRLTGYKLEDVFSGEDMTTRIDDYYNQADDLSGIEMMYILKRNG